jgi:hypothetical protein
MSMHNQRSAHVAGQRCAGASLFPVMKDSVPPYMAACTYNAGKTRVRDKKKKATNILNYLLLFKLLFLFISFFVLFIYLFLFSFYVFFVVS